MEAAQPPVPPQVAAQQGPPIRQFAQGAGPAAPGPGDTGQNPDALLGQLVDEAGKILTKIAQIAQQTKPELIPILKQSVQALVMFAGKIKTGQQGAGQGGSPDGGNQGTAADTAPDAGGGAAMGMQQ